MTEEEKVRRRLLQAGNDPIEVENKLSADFGDSYKGLSDSQMEQILTKYSSAGGKLSQPSDQLQSYNNQFWDKWAEAHPSTVVDSKRVAGFKKAVGATPPGDTFLGSVWDAIKNIHIPRFPKKKKKIPTPKKTPWLGTGTIISGRRSGK